ncbi:hypothetical protein L249_7580 [Ophiocordyceps polyrhachis-furcata BCC 54312]|uniref:Uncharacterized protein n=1 Tax=Ophiocordyceps polyrhachis-furcata BCC 54312 TaxID=1330021 RepID=A0A367L9W9_9HYPO|nr:hypothetical protein L249_7580 [Ophiocordyceps polyrhachis-furcata BCC 54312]
MIHRFTMARLPLLLSLVAAVLATEPSSADSFDQGVELQQATAAGNSSLGDRLLHFVGANPPDYIDSLMRPVPGLKDASKAKCFYQRSIFQPDHTTVAIRYHPSLDFETFNHEEHPVLFSLNRSTAKIDSSWTSWQTSDNVTFSGPRMTTVEEFPLDFTLRESCPGRHRCAADTWTFTVEMTGSCTLIPFVDEECLNLPAPKSGKTNTTVMSLLGNHKIDEDWAIAKEYFDMTRSKHMYFGMTSHRYGRGGIRSVTGQKNELRKGLYWPDEVKYHVTYKQTPRCRVQVPLMRTDGKPVREQVISQTKIEPKQASLPSIDVKDAVMETASSEDAGSSRVARTASRPTTGSVAEQAEEKSRAESEKIQQDEDDEGDIDWWGDGEDGDDIWLDADEVDWFQEADQSSAAQKKDALEEERRQLESLWRDRLEMDTRRESLKDLIGGKQKRNDGVF